MSHTKIFWMAAVFGLLCCGYLISQANVTRKHKSSSQSWGAYESTSSDFYQADRSAQESTTQWTRGLMKTMSGGKPIESISITRLDKELVWQLDPKKKTYTEMTFAEFRDMLKKGQEEMAEGEEEADTVQVPEDQYDWTVEAKSDPNPKTINGWNCRNIHAVATGVNRGEMQDTVWIMMDAWNSLGVPGGEEIAAFHMAYLKALGLDETALTPGLTSAAMLYQKQFSALAEEMKKAPGEPVTSTIEIKRRQLVGPSIGKAVGEAAKEEIMGKLPFGKKKEKKPEEPRWEHKVKFSVTTELTEAAVGPVDATKFEVPTGYELKKEKK
ncbi:MAG TPA: hypothetical protein VF398_00110 [bacterium]|jgi:hypothetical protein